MARKNRATEVNTPREQERMSKYYNANSQSINQLAEAYDNGDLSSMRQNLTENVDKGFIGGLYSVYDAEFKENIVKTILRKNKFLIKDKKARRYEAKYKESPRVKRYFEKRKISQKKNTIRQKQKSGTIYTRSKPKSFSQQEIKFLKNNRNVKNKELVRRFNKLFYQRSSSSIISKKYRIKT